MLLINNILIRLHPDDTVAVALTTLRPGEKIELESISYPIRTLIPEGHKIAIRHMEQDEPIRKYGQVIGTCKGTIRIGEHVHIHNINESK